MLVRGLFCCVFIVSVCLPCHASECSLIQDEGITISKCDLLNRLVTTVDGAEFWIDVWIHNPPNLSGPNGEVSVYSKIRGVRQNLLRFDVYDRFEGGVFKEGDVVNYVELMAFSGVGYKLTVLEIKNGGAKKIGEFSSRTIPKLEFKGKKAFVVVRKDSVSGPDEWLPL